MRRHTFTWILVAVVLTLVPIQPASANHLPHPHFRDVWCDPSDIDYVKHDQMTREGSRSYASTAIGDGYQWAGGCWNSSHHDDQPNDPPQQEWTGGEGGDCSGFVFKSWYLSGYNAEFHWRHPLRYYHGPYNSSAFKNGSGSGFHNVLKSQTRMMDAFAKDGHVGMVQTPLATPDGMDMIIEAKSERDGTGVWPRAYRSDPAYAGVRRANWTEPPAVPSVPCVRGCITP